MKMTSGVRLNERRKGALERLLAQDPARWLVGATPEHAAQWTARRDAEIATLKKRTGQLFS